MVAALPPPPVAGSPAPLGPGTPPTGPATLSPSRIADFLACPLRYRFRAVDGLTEPPTPASVRGTLVHAVLERLFDLPAQQRSRESAQALLEPEWERLRAACPDLAEIHGEEPGASERWLGSAVRLLDRWFTLEDPTRLEPAARELYVEADLGGLTLRGYVDRLDVAPDGRMRVVDYKTGRSPAPGREGRALFQLACYALVLWRHHDRVPSRLQLVYLGDGQVVVTDPDEADLLAAERKVKAVARAIADALADDDFRASPGRRCGWCGFRDRCPAWEAGPQHPSPPRAGVPGAAGTVGDGRAASACSDN